MTARRAMKSSTASEVKVQGHANEAQFAEAIGGSVNKGDHQDKRDVIDQHHGTHSVKAGSYWQVFLYSRSRIVKNTIFKALGNTSKILLRCLDSFPETFDEYQANKMAAKQALRPHMRDFLAELQKPNISRAFFDKALFDNGNAHYLSVYAGKARDAAMGKVFHIFHKEDVLDALMKDVTLANSQARRVGEVSEQKVVLKSSVTGCQIGEIEIRVDSETHYREVKFRLMAKHVINVLQTLIGPATEASSRVRTYGKAVAPFKKQTLPEPPASNPDVARLPELPALAAE